METAGREMLWVLNKIEVLLVHLGGNFTSGYSSGPVYISVKNNLEFQIIGNNLEIL